MFKAYPFSKQAPVPQLSQRRGSSWFRLKHSVIIVAAAHSSACSMLIRFDDGIDDDVEVNPAQGGSTSGPSSPDAGSTAGSGGIAGSAGSGGIAGSSGAGGSGPLGPVGADAGVTLEPSPFDLAFIEDPEESDATLRLVSSELALRLGPSGGEPPWRLTLRPSGQAGDVLDFAWSPDGLRIAVRYVDVRGVRVALFAAPEWKELNREEAASAATLADLDVTRNYRWSPSGDALAVELVGEERPLVGAYVIEGESAIGVGPAPLAGPIETMEWRSPGSLYVIQPQQGDPELLELRLNQRELDAPRSLFSVLFFPVELRRVPGGLVAASDDPTNSLNFWPESADQGSESSFTPSAYLSGGAAFAAEIVGASAQISPIGSVFDVLDTVPDCPTILTWLDGPEPRSLGGAKIACLGVEDGAASIRVHAYDASGARSSIELEHDVLRADFASTDSWEGHARGFSRAGEFLALASAAHDVLVDLRGAAPSLRVQEAAAQGSTARAFSPSGEVLLRQRGRSVEALLLSSVADEPVVARLPDAFVEAPACVTAHHAAAWCGGAGAGQSASARWSSRGDVAAFLGEGEGLSVLAATPDLIGLEREFVSTCGAGCVGQYEFGR